MVATGRGGMSQLFFFGEEFPDIPLVHGSQRYGLGGVNNTATAYSQDVANVLTPAEVYSLPYQVQRGVRFYSSQFKEADTCRTEGVCNGII